MKNIHLRTEKNMYSERKFKCVFSSVTWYKNESAAKNVENNIGDGVMLLFTPIDRAWNMKNNVHRFKRLFFLMKSITIFTVISKLNFFCTVCISLLLNLCTKVQKWIKKESFPQRTGKVMKCWVDYVWWCNSKQWKTQKKEKHSGKKFKYNLFLWKTRYWSWKEK